MYLPDYVPTLCKQCVRMLEDLRSLNVRNGYKLQC